MLFAANVSPVSSIILKVVPPLAAFRVPARSVLPLFVFVPVLAMAAAFTRTSPPPVRVRWAALAVAAIVIAAGLHVPGTAREVAAWAGMIAVIVVARLMPKRPVIWALPIIVALGVTAFQARFPRIPVDPPEQGPRALHQLVDKQAPELRNSALERIEILRPSLPYDVSLAWASHLSSLDGVWYPPRRFLDLLGALGGAKLSPSTCVFQLAGSPMFPVLQRLYNVRYFVKREGTSWTMQRLPPTAGPAWFPSRIDMISEPSDMAAALAGPVEELTHALQSRGWLLRRDHDDVRVDPACASAAVDAAGTDALGQLAVFDVTTPADCPLIVSTNYVSTLQARAMVNGSYRAAEVFPIDVSLTAIVVPRGATRVTLSPEVEAAIWVRIAAFVGLAVLLGALALALRENASGRSVRAGSEPADLRSDR